MDSISISEFKAICLRLLREVKATGKSLTVFRGKEPVAVIIPPPKPKKRKDAFGCMKEVTKINGDLVAPLSDIDWEALK